MKWVILIGLAIVVALEYAIISIGKQADEDAEEMYEKWKEEHDENKHTGN